MPVRSTHETLQRLIFFQALPVAATGKGTTRFRASTPRKCSKRPGAARAATICAASRRDWSRSRSTIPNRYGRKVAEVIDPASGQALNLTLVEAGQAAVYHRYCADSRYRQAEASAKAAGLGIWRTPGEHQRPWEWRRR